MTCNLISLGILESNGHRYSTKGGVLKASKGVVVVMKGLKQGILYILHDSTVIGSTTVLVFSYDDDLSHLWNMRLDHTSEKGITTLSKRGLLSGECICKLIFCNHCVFGK